MPRKGPIHKVITPWFLLHFQWDMLRRARLAHDVLLETKSERLAIPSEVMSMLAGATAQALSQLEEALVMQREMYPEVFDPLATKFAPDLELWGRFRDDAAHLADRCFRGSDAAWQNVSIVPNEEWGEAVEILHYEADVDSLRTGHHLLRFPEALEQAKTLVEAVSNACHRAALLKIFDFPKLVTSEGKPVPNGTPVVVRTYL